MDVVSRLNLEPMCGGRKEGSPSSFRSWRRLRQSVRCTMNRIYTDGESFDVKRLLARVMCPIPSRFRIVSGLLKQPFGAGSGRDRPRNNQPFYLLSWQFFCFYKEHGFYGYFNVEEELKIAVLEATCASFLPVILYSTNQRRFKRTIERCTVLLK